SLRIVCKSTPAFFSSPESEMPKPRCAFPMISPTLSSRGIIFCGFCRLNLNRLSLSSNAQITNLIKYQFFNRSGNAGNGKCRARFLFHGSHCNVIDAARNDVIKRRKIARNIQRKAVHGDPMANAYADGSDLAVADPNSGKRFTPGRSNLEFSEKINEQLLEPAQRFVQILTASAQID